MNGFSKLVRGSFIISCAVMMEWHMVKATAFGSVALREVFVTWHERKVLVAWH